MITASALIARADEIDRRLGPITGREADRIAVELRQAAKVIADARPMGEPIDPRFLPTHRDLIALREDAASMRGAGLPVTVNVAPAVLYMAWPNSKYDNSDPESSRWRCISFNIPNPDQT